MDDLLPFVFLLCCFIPTVGLMIAVYMAFRGGKRLFQVVVPSEKSLTDQFVALREESPDAPTHQLIHKIAHRQALRAGAIGALTSVGGVFTLPLALPADMFTTARIQSSTLHLVAWAYELDHPGQVPKVLDINEILGLKSGGLLSVKMDGVTHQLILMQSERFSQMAIRRALLIVGQKAFAKVIPFVGLFIGFAVNYLTARALNTLAIAWYSGNVNKMGAQLKAARENIGNVTISPDLLQAGKDLSRQANTLREKLNDEAIHEDD